MSKIGYHTAASGVMAYQMALDVTANNMANVNTNGFKASRPSFADLLYTERNNENEETQFGHGVKVQKTDMMFEQSTLRSTNRELDFAALDEGFFAVLTPEGNVNYTKDGAFYISRQDEASPWELVNEFGAYVLDYEATVFRFLLLRAQKTTLMQLLFTIWWASILLKTHTDLIR